MDFYLNPDGTFSLFPMEETPKRGRPKKNVREEPVQKETELPKIPRKISPLKGVHKEFLKALMRGGPSDGSIGRIYEALKEKPGGERYCSLIHEYDNMDVRFPKRGRRAPVSVTCGKRTGFLVKKDGAEPVRYSFLQAERIWLYLLESSRRNAQLCRLKSGVVKKKKMKMKQMKYSGKGGTLLSG